MSTIVDIAERALCKLLNDDFGIMLCNVLNGLTTPAQLLFRQYSKEAEIAFLFTASGGIPKNAISVKEFFFMTLNHCKKAFLFHVMR